MTNDELELGAGQDQPDDQEHLTVSRDEMEALQAEVAELRQQTAEMEAVKAAKGHGWRRFAVILLIVAGCLVAAVANVTLWVRAIVLDTDAWVSAVGPLSQDEVIVDAVSAYAVGEVFNEFDAQALAQEALPEELTYLSGPLVSALEELIRDVVAKLIASDQFNAIWVAVNRAAHKAFVGALHGDGGLVSLTEGKLVVDLSDLFGFVQGSLGLGAVDLFEEAGWGTFVLFESQQVAVLQQVLNTLDRAGIWLAVGTLALFVVAWLVSLWRRRTLLWIGVGVVITMTLTLILYALLQPVLLASIADPLIRTVADAIWNVVTRGLVWQTVFFLVIGVLLAIGAALAGPSRRAVAFRNSVSTQVDRLRK
ncbi:MAG: hypothetical protein PVG56_01310 [Anaerolineae bacterium]|jgi:hypothetical protein